MRSPGGEGEGRGGEGGEGEFRSFRAQLPLCLLIGDGPPLVQSYSPLCPHLPSEAVPPWFRRLSARGQAKPVESDKLKAGMYGVVRR